MVRNKKVKYFLVYTAVFCVLAAAVYFPFWSHGKGLIRYSDGLQQFYYSIRYFGNYLREYAAGIANGVWEPPMWDMSIGYGSDILTTLHTYAIGDPLNLLAVFVDGNGTELLANFLVLLRIYLSGLAFSAFSFYHHNGEEETLLGALVYSFCGWGLVSGMAYFSFSNPMIYFPLICLGVDKIFREGRPYLFEIMLAVTTFSFFYFLYMTCILTVFYVGAQYIRLHYTLTVKSIAVWIGKFIAYACIGIGIGAVVFLPVLLSLLTQQRLGLRHDTPLLYPFGYYLTLPKNFVSFAVPSNEQAAFGFAATVFPATVLLFMGKKCGWLKAGFAAVSLGMLLPGWGKLMNGFSYPANRWVWAFGLVAAYILVKVYSDFGRLTKKKKIILGTLGLLAVPYWYVVCEKITPGLLALEALILISLLEREKMRGYKQLIFLATVISISVNAYSIFEVEDLTKNWRNNLDFCSIDSLLSKLPGGKLGNLGTARYDKIKLREGVYPNSDFALGLNGTGYQFSTSDSGVSQFMEDMYVNCFSGISYDNLDNRAALELLTGVRYFIVKEEDRALMPWSYKISEEKSDGTYLIGESTEFLPLGYTYDSKIPYTEWLKLPAAGRQEAVLQGLVADDEKVKMPNLSFTSEEIPYTTVSGIDITKGIDTGGKGAEVEISLDGQRAGEYYAVFENLDYEGAAPVADISIIAGSREKTISYGTGRHNQATGKHNYLCNLGYFAGMQDQVRLSFIAPGNYTWDRLEIVCQPMDGMTEQLNKLRENILTNVQIGNNRISGFIDLDKNKSLCLTIPYRDGWKAYVDGEKTPVYQANIMFIGLDLGPGGHEVVFRYRTPGIAAGALISAGCAGIFIVQYIRRKKKKTYEKEKN